MLIPKSQFQASWCQFYILASVGKVEFKGSYAFVTFGDWSFVGGADFLK